jgi:hypothetical protein
MLVNHTDTLIRACVDGGGITGQSIDLVARHLNSGELRRVLAPWITGRNTLYAALPSRKFIPQTYQRAAGFSDRVHASRDPENGRQGQLSPARTGLKPGKGESMRKPKHQLPRLAWLRTDLALRAGEYALAIRRLPMA